MGMKLRRLGVLSRVLLKLQGLALQVLLPREQLELAL
jgi:hypothetical protein